MDNRDLRNRNRTSSPGEERRNKPSYTRPSYEERRTKPTEERRTRPTGERRPKPTEGHRTRPTEERRTRPAENVIPQRPRMTREQRRQAYLKRRRKAYFFRGVFVTAIILILLIFWLIISSLFKAFTKDDVEETIESDVIITEDLVEELEDSNVVSFLAVGDNIGHERVFTYADENSGTAGDGLYDFLPSYTYMADYIADADLSFINQETIIGGDELGIYGYPAFNSPEQWAADLTTLGFDIVNASSNHSLDMGIGALENSLEIWSQYDEVLYAGVYDSEEDASTIRTIERNGITFSVISYTYSTNGYDIPNDYCINLFDEASIREDVAAAKEVSDVVIVSAHWGDESIYELNSLQTEYAQLFADLEVDLVIGTHPHVIQSLEWITGENGNETLVAYSLGNFLSTMETVDTQLEGMLTLDFVKNDDGSVSIENVEWTALINHFGDGTFTVMPLSEYTDELNAVHYVLAEECPNAIETFQAITDDIIGDGFTINY